MARTTKKAAPKSKARPARKAAGKKVAPKRAAPKRAAPKRAAAKKAPAKRVAPKKAVKAAPTGHPQGHVPEALKAATLARVARHRKGEHHDEGERQPLPVEAQLPNPVVDQLHNNWGETKNKTVARNDKPINWFRRSAKPPAK